EEERSTEAAKWVYSMVSESECKMLENPNSGATDVTCCSTDGCNQPDNGKCWWPSNRRRTLRKFTNLFNLKW
ncbi:unnamed protein product, partial [Rotaria sp. Silwood2]